MRAILKQMLYRNSHLVIAKEKHTSEAESTYPDKQLFSYEKSTEQKVQASYFDLQRSRAKYRITLVGVIAGKP